MSPESRYYQHINGSYSHWFTCSFLVEWRFCWCLKLSDIGFWACLFCRACLTCVNSVHNFVNKFSCSYVIYARQSECMHIIKLENQGTSSYFMTTAKFPLDIKRQSWRLEKSSARRLKTRHKCQVDTRWQMWHKVGAIFCCPYKLAHKAEVRICGSKSKMTTSPSLLPNFVDEQKLIYSPNVTSSSKVGFKVLNLIFHYSIEIRHISRVISPVWQPDYWL